jgi:hypothetical protein
MNELKILNDKYIAISENVGLWVNANGKFGIHSGKQETTITPAEFNRLAMEAPLVKRMVEFIKENTTYYDNGKKLLAEIAELEKAK